MAIRNENMCCFCIPLRLSAIILLWLNLVGSMTGLWMTIIIAGFAEEHALSPGLAYGVLLLDQVTWLLFSILALHGACERNAYSMKPLIALWIVRLVLICLALIVITSGMSSMSEYLVYGIKHLNHRDFRFIQLGTSLELATVNTLFTNFVLGSCVLYVIYTYYSELMEEGDYNEVENEKFANARYYPTAMPSEYATPPSYYQSTHYQYII